MDVTLSNEFIKYIHSEIEYYQHCFGKWPTMVIVSPFVVKVFNDALKVDENDEVYKVLGLDMFVSPKVKYAEVF